MSQYKAVIGDTEILYGWDHALGWWLDVYSDYKDIPMIELSTFMTGLTLEGLLDTLAEYGVEAHKNIERREMFS